MSFTRDLLHHPRRLRLRRMVFQVHLWSGLLLAAYLVLISLSGSILVYKDELTRWSLPRDLTPFDARHVATPETVSARFMRDQPGCTILNLQFPSPVLPAFLLTGVDQARQPARWIADPVDGTLHPARRSWLDLVHDLHYYLLLPSTWGMQVNALGAALLLLASGTGIVLWWPGLRTWLRGLRVNLRGSWQRINYDLHSAIGFWTLGVVVWWALSGVYFGFYPQVTAIVAAVSPLQGMKAPVAAEVPLLHPGTRASLQAILQAAQAASPQGHLWSVSEPIRVTDDSYVLLDRAAPGDFSHRDIVRVRSSDASVLSVWHYGERHSPGDWILWSMHPLHFGTLWGSTAKLLWFLLGLSVCVLTLTGVLMYWNRYLSKRILRSAVRGRPT